MSDNDSSSIEENANEEPKKTKAPPKKRARAAVQSNEESTEGEGDGDTVVKKAKKKVRRSYNDNPTALEMVKEAFMELEERKGVSVSAVRAYLIENYKVNEGSLKHRMKKAIQQLVDKNILSRPGKEPDNTKLSLTGRYVLLKQKADPKANIPRVRPASLRQIKGPKAKKGKGKKKRRKAYY